ncbi:glycerophosphotransferase [Sphingobium jiangsuense]|uniref:Glycosyltransferase n=1 Tax=Sphingobium jiangsuense TaxID=870476 RepID=A0A7W6BIN6_9SPHN|nr:hypothetical protein [Sphingobium jiangsuense]MBB3927618.1 hypothetical protein [Sphingobium jiangsuense]GLS98727.1 glycerophosphotransferase [Sphingobium jiangsuense]
MTEAKAARRIAFLFNHDAAHQIAHTAGVMRAYALAQPQDEVLAIVGTPTIAATVAALVGEDVALCLHWHELSLPDLEKALLAPVNKLAPVYRLARLRRHLDLFAGCDLVVSPERTCLWVKRQLGNRSPSFVFIPHGAGDRDVSYHPALGGFDLMLVSGRKVADEMIRQGVTSSNQVRIVGYPKFDTIDLSRRVDPFGNGMPTFLYNPHFDPLLSSWYRHGNALIAAFRDDPSLGNLIVAPHVMLFRKKLHYSPEYHRLRRRPNVEGLSHGKTSSLIAANIYVDLAGPALFDMSYTLSADAYIGDASSQVYEFLLRPRPCFFFDVRGISKGADLSNPPADVRFWLAGEVVRTVPELVVALRRRQESGVRHRAGQIALFEETMSVPPLEEGEEAGKGQHFAACDRAARELALYAHKLPFRL